MDLRTNDKWHSSEKGCDIKNNIPCKFATYKYGYNESECLTHGVKICRCGWEWGWHGGEDNRAPVKIFAPERQKTNIKLLFKTT